MSEKKNIPEIIYIDKIHFNEGCTPMFKDWNTKRFSYHEIEFILKSKYDELLDRLGKVECYVIDLRREKDELSLENARLTENLAKLKAELEKVKFKPSNIVISTETTYTKQNNPTK